MRVSEGAIHLHALLHRSTAALRHQDVFRAWHGWSSVVADRQHALRRVRGSLQAWQGKGLRRAWHSWHAACVAVWRLRQCARVVLGGAESRAWRTWAAATTTRAEAWSRLRWAAGALRHRRARCAFSEWHTHCAGHATRLALRSLLHRSAVALKRRDERMALLGWHGYCGRATRMQQRIRRALDRWAGQGCGRAWSQWRAVAAVAATLRHQLRRLRLARERRAMDAWAAAAATCAW